jgi:hypothetical protein
MQNFIIAGAMYKGGPGACYGVTAMAKKKTTPEEAPEGVLVSAAKGLGSAAGKIASLAGAKGEAAAEGAPARKPPAPKIPKLASKNKTRLPRKQKKALKKAGERA